MKCNIFSLPCPIYFFQIFFKVETWSSLLIVFSHTLISALFRAASLLWLFSTGLLIWHSHLIGRGETSVEYNQNKRVSRTLNNYNFVFSNPYDFGVQCNWMRFLGLEMPDNVRTKEGKVRAGMWSIYGKRIFTKLILPIDHTPYDGHGIYYGSNIPSIENALKDLSDL